MQGKMFQEADGLLKTAPKVNKMLNACVSEEERNMKLVIVVVREKSKGIARVVLTNKSIE